MTLIAITYTFSTTRGGNKQDEENNNSLLVRGSLVATADWSYLYTIGAMQVETDSWVKTAFELTVASWFILVTVERSYWLNTTEKHVPQID